MMMCLMKRNVVSSEGRNKIYFGYAESRKTPNVIELFYIAGFVLLHHNYSFRSLDFRFYFSIGLFCMFYLDNPVWSRESAFYPV